MNGFGFHPVVTDWFSGRYAAPTEPQAAGWPHIAAGRHTLIAAPTGSGKTLTAFLAVIDRLFKEAAEGRLRDGMRVLYLSPLRALSNDMRRNLDVPLREIYEQAQAAGLSVPQLRVGLRTGDTPSSQRQALVRNPPHIFVTTPESLYLMLTSRRGREALRTVDTVIVDEIHALVRDKRGSHMALSLERLESLCGRPLQRIGISATQKPIERMAEFLLGGQDRTYESVDNAQPETWQPTLFDASASGGRQPPDDLREPAPAPCSIVDVGHIRQLDLGIEIPTNSELSAACSAEQWSSLHDRMVELIQSHRSTLIFVNTRRMAERVTFALTQLLGEDHVAAHHGSLSAESRLTTEQRLKHGQIKAVVATSSLELGIDVGYIDLVIQIGSPGSIAGFLQRIGRSGHALGLIPKGRLLAMTRDELVECMALVRAIKARRLDVIQIPEAPVDVLAQQIVAECAAVEWDTDELFAMCRRAYPYRNLERKTFDETLQFLSEGLTPASGRNRTFLHHDHVNRRVRGRKGAGLTAINNGGAIPEVDNYRVVVEPENTVVGSVDEEFAVESSSGDIFLLGNSSWQIIGLRGNDLRVADAHGAPPTIPFWRGEAPGRSLELSEEVSRLRSDLESLLDNSDSELPVLGEGEAPAELTPANDDVTFGESAPASVPTTNLDRVVRWLLAETHCTTDAALQVATYVASEKAAIGLLPTQERVIFERFFDESGGMQLVVHAPFGARINRAWGLAMRKRFCRSFDFELQATADDDGFILSLGPQHSFPIESLFPMLRCDNAYKLLEQAVIYVPMFQVRWRWNATRSLFVERMRNGQKVPPAIQRFRSQDTMTAVFPKLTGCQEEHTGDHEIPDHPLVQQTMHDCLYEAVDLAGLMKVLERVEKGEITFIARDTREPSPFTYELLNANPYAFLDGGEVQERRARAVSTRRTLNPEELRDLGKLDPQAIETVVGEAQPLIRSGDELHDVLLARFAVRAEPHWQPFYQQLERAGRAACITRPDGVHAWVAAERWPAIQGLWKGIESTPAIVAPSTVRHDWDDVEVRVTMIRGFVESSGPITALEIAEALGIGESEAFSALEAVEAEGIVIRGQFRDGGFIDKEPEAKEFERADARAAARAAEDTLATPPAVSGGLNDKSKNVEWCHRALLSRIHRLTIAGLRREVQPVDAATYQRYLFRHQGVMTGSRRQGANGLFEVIGQLQGLDIPTVCWERDILPLRVENYKKEWLDELSLSGEVSWGRLYPPARDPEKSRPTASLTRVAPISLFLREDREWLLETAGETKVDDLSSPAQEVVELLSARGAMFSSDIQSAAKLLPSQLEDVLGELVARGFITADGFSGLRNLVRESTTGETSMAGAPAMAKLIRKRRSSQSVGRWSLWRTKREGEAPAEPQLSGEHSVASGSAGASPSRESTVEHWAWQLLRRWGVVYRDLLDRESGAPRWWELVRVYRRMEARGEIRGGRFIKGVAGEQYCAAETVVALRKLRADESRAETVVFSAADPLNLAGIITSGPRIPAQAGNRVAYVNGVLAADWQAGRITWHAGCTEELRLRIRERLLNSVEPKQRGSVTETPAAADAVMLNAGPLQPPRSDVLAPRQDSTAFPLEGPVPSGKNLHVRIAQSKPRPSSGSPFPKF
ncbi:MAG TPA: DEAD/DEAH box helicase [Caulifigura sp.]|nr:DEAD/DEAH box helicase [Caulifigura sp.]